MKLTWMGSGTGAGYYVDLYTTQDGKQVIIGSMGPDDPIREAIADAYNKRIEPESNGIRGGEQK
jgi:hypothetical protein